MSSHQRELDYSVSHHLFVQEGNVVTIWVLRSSHFCSISLFYSTVAQILTAVCWLLGFWLALVPFLRLHCASETPIFPAATVDHHIDRVYPTRRTRFEHPFFPEEQSLQMEERGSRRSPFQVRRYRLSPGGDLLTILRLQDFRFWLSPSMALVIDKELPTQSAIH